MKINGSGCFILALFFFLSAEHAFAEKPQQVPKEFKDGVGLLCGGNSDTNGFLFLISENRQQVGRASYRNDKIRYLLSDIEIYADYYQWRDEILNISFRLFRRDLILDAGTIHSCILVTAEEANISAHHTLNRILKKNKI